MKKTVTLFCLIFMIFLIPIGKVGKVSAITQNDAVEAMGQNVQEAELPPLTLYARGAVLMDAGSGRVLYAKNAKEQLPMASTTKIMTLILTLEKANLEDTVTVSSYAASMPDVQLNIREGEQYRLKDLLYSLMLESHNDSAVAIAEHVGGSVEKFALMMNQKAQEIGCQDTWFITPNGLDATAEYTNARGEKETRQHVTTARDLAAMMSYCIEKSPKREEFLEITRTPSYSFADLSGKRSFGCTNHNAFLSMMDGALSGKTGFTSKAGYCYVGALRQGERTYTVALLACGWPGHKTYKWSDTRKLMDYGLKYYTYHPIEEAKMPEEACASIPVTLAQTDRIGEVSYVGVEAKAEKEQTKGVLLNPKERITVRLEKVKELTAPVEKGQEVGCVHYMVGDEEWRTTRLVAAEKIERIDWKWSIKKVFAYWLIR